MQAWRVHRHGRPSDVLALEDVEPGTPGPGEVRVRVDATTLNFNDIDGIYGRYRTVAPPLPYTPGMEVLGHVDACGEGTDPWRGRRVVATPTGAFGGYAESVIAPAVMTFAMPDDLDAATAAAIYFPFHLSWLALLERGRLQRGETVLVHAAAGGIGSAAVQLAVHAGARVIATAGSDEKAEFCRGLGADVVVNYRADGFGDAVLDATDGRGVDVAFDTVGGAVTVETFRCMAFNGRHLVVGFSGGIEAEDQGVVPRPIVFGSFDFCGVILSYADDPVAVKRARGFNLPSRALGDAIHANVLGLIARGDCRAVVGREVPFNEIPSALEALEQRATVGRTIAHVRPSGH
jgi:NADPH2:quinone reductase